MRAQLQKLQAKFDHQLIVGQQHEQESNSLSSKLQQIELEATTNKHRSEQEIKRLKYESYVGICVTTPVFMKRMNGSPQGA